MGLLGKIALGSCGLVLTAGLLAAEPDRAPDAVRYFRCALQNDQFYHLLCEERRQQFARRGDTIPARGASLDEVLQFVDLNDPLLTADASADIAPAAAASPRLWSIPLYNAPFQSSDVAFLVRAVMCPRGAPCEVTLAPTIQ
jgi:hypothetical protein